jgi:hypothetical protein
MSAPVSASFLTSTPARVPFRTSLARMSLFLRSALLSVLSLSSRLAIEPVATAYELPPSAMKTAIVAIALA